MAPMKKALTDRLSGNRPSIPRALASATAVGAATGLVVYRFLRS